MVYYFRFQRVTECVLSQNSGFRQKYYQLKKSGIFRRGREG